MKVVFDAGPLITACKFEVAGSPVVDHLAAFCEIMIAPRVEEEVAILGARYVDGLIAGERIAKGVIQVVSVKVRKWTDHLSGYSLGEGERQSIELCGQEGGVDGLVTDDYLAFMAATRLGMKTWILPDLVIELTRGKCLPPEIAEAILKAISSRYRAGVVHHSLVRLQEMISDAKSCSAD